MIWLYRIAWLLLAPLLALWLLKRLFYGKEERSRLMERFGFSTKKRPQGPLIWVHGASVGEMMSVFPMLDALLKKDPSAHILLTSGTVTSARLVASKLPPYQGRVLHQYIPLDFWLCVRHFLKRWQPDVSVFVESEFWPELLYQAPNPMLINARVTERSFKRYQRYHAFFKAGFSRLQQALAQTENIKQRLTLLGVSPVQVATNLKWDAAPLPAAEKEISKMRTAINKRPVVCFSSTHAGDDPFIAAIHLQLRREIPNVLTLIIPRHPHRGTDIAHFMKTHHLSTLQRSHKSVPGPQCDVYIADSLGEMGLWFRMSDVVVMGGSLFPFGGQNPLEPLKLECITLCGPHMFNFESILQGLAPYGVPELFENAEKLTARIETLLTDAKQRKIALKHLNEALKNSGGGSVFAADAILTRLTKG